MKLGSPEFRKEVTRRYREQLWLFGSACRRRIAVELVRELKRRENKR